MRFSLSRFSSTSTCPSLSSSFLSHLLHCELYLELDNLIAMESLCFSAKGSDDAYDVSVSLTLPGRPIIGNALLRVSWVTPWIPKLKSCNTWTEWLTLTKGFAQVWHAMLNLKPPESSCACDAPVETLKRDHVTTVIHGVLHGHQIHIAVWRFWWATRL